MVDLREDGDGLRFRVDTLLLQLGLLAGVLVDLRLRGGQHLRIGLLRAGFAVAACLSLWLVGVARSIERFSVAGLIVSVLTLLILGGILFSQVSREIRADAERQKAVERLRSL